MGNTDVVALGGREEGRAVPDLPLRLQTVAGLIPSCGTVVDVGSDHGKLGAWCLMKKVCKSVIATDIHALPARRTEELFTSLGLSRKSSVQVTDGLCGIALKEDMTIVIAGMGGLEVCKILRSAMAEKEEIPSGMKLVLQPQRSFYEVRSFLCESGFSIRKERIAKDRGRYYVVILCEFTGKTYEISEPERFLGPLILKEKPEYFDESMAHQKEVMGKRALGDPRCAAILNDWEKWL